MSRAQSEALTQHLTEVLCANREKLAECYVSRSALEKVQRCLRKQKRGGGSASGPEAPGRGAGRRCPRTRLCQIAAAAWPGPALLSCCRHPLPLPQSVLETDSRFAGFRSEVLKSQELQVATFLRDTERLQSNIEKIRSEIRCGATLAGRGQLEARSGG